MWQQFSDAALDLLTGDHTPRSRVEVWQAGAPVYVLEVVSGGVNADATRAVRRNLACELVDPTGRLTRGDVDDLLNPYDCEIAPFRGVRVGSTVVSSVLTPNEGFGVQPFGTSGFGGVEATLRAVRTWRDEFAPLGVFGLTGRSVVDTPEGLAISLDGQDRAMGYQGPMRSSLAISSGTPIETAIARLLSTRNPGVAMDAMVSGFVTGPLLFPADIDVWAEARKLAESVGGVLFHDRTGRCVFALAGPASDAPVASWREGDGLLLGATRREDSDTIANVVVAGSRDGRITFEAKDDDPASPTYAGGRYGRRPADPPLISQHIGSLEQAQQAATTRLAYELGRSETVTFSAVPHPGLDVDEVVTVHRPRVGLNHRAVIVESLDMPLAADAPMRVGCRRSVLTQDGAVLPVEAL